MLSELLNNQYVLKVWVILSKFSWMLTVWPYDTFGKYSVFHVFYQFAHYETSVGSVKF